MVQKQFDNFSPSVASKRYCESTKVHLFPHKYSVKNALTHKFSKFSSQSVKIYLSSDLHWLNYAMLNFFTLQSELIKNKELPSKNVFINHVSLLILIYL